MHLAPLIYTLVLYRLVYFLPFGVFEAWTTGEDGPVAWLQFAAYAGASAGRCRAWPGC